MTIAKWYYPGICCPPANCPEPSDQEFVDALCLQIFRGQLKLIEVTPDREWAVRDLQLKECCVATIRDINDTIVSGNILIAVELLLMHLSSNKILLLFCLLPIILGMAVGNGFAENDFHSITQNSFERLVESLTPRGHQNSKATIVQWWAYLNKVTTTPMKLILRPCKLCSKITPLLLINLYGWGVKSALDSFGKI